MTNFIEKCLLELANIRMRQLFEDTNLPRKCCGFPRINVTCGRSFLDFVRLNHFHGEPLASLTMHSFVDGGKGTFPKLNAKIIECMDAFSRRTSGYKSKDVAYGRGLVRVVEREYRGELSSR
jgi:hypothetical protein